MDRTKLGKKIGENKAEGRRNIRRLRVWWLRYVERLLRRAEGAEVEVEGR
jgi:hypothetical protein